MSNAANNAEQQQKALSLLKATSWFKDASESLLMALSKIMEPIEAEDGDIFLQEDEEIRDFFVIEEGVLARTKMSVDTAQEAADVQASTISGDYEAKQPALRPSIKLQRRTSTLQLKQASIPVDELFGRGRVTGFLHAMEQGDKAFATVAAQGRAKVWRIDGADFRAVMGASPQHALDVLHSMARELRVGTKSLRSLIQKQRHKKKSGDSQHATKVCRILCYDASSWVVEGFKPAVEAFNQDDDNKSALEIEMDFTTERLSPSSATYAAGYDGVCLFVNDRANADALQTLSVLDVHLICMRCAGFDRVDVKAAKAFGMTVARVPAYSPYAVAEMAIALLMSVNRKIIRATNRVKMANFTLDQGLMGVDIFGKTVAVMGTGKIGRILCTIVKGFGAKLICYDVFESDEVKAMGGTYVTKDECFRQADVLFLMMPLLPATKHTINEQVLPVLKKGVLLINTARGALVDTKALLKGLRSGVIGGVGMDVYENEAEYFFQDWSAKTIQDTDLESLLGNPRVVLTAHQAFFTKEAVDKIVSTTIDNIRDYSAKGLRGQAHPNNCIPVAK